MNRTLGEGRAALRMAMALLMGMVGLGTLFAPAPAAMAAQRTGLVDDGTYISDTSREEITWGRAWSFDDQTSFVDTDVERISLAGDSGLLDIIYFPPGLNLAATRDDLFDLLTNGADDTLQVDRGDYQASSGRVSYSLDKVLVGDVELAMFTLLFARADDTLITVFYSTPDLFEDGMLSAQRSIAIDGVGIFQGIKPAGMADALFNAPSLLDGASSRSSRTTSDPTQTTRTRTDETETPRARSGQAETPEVTTDETETPRARTGRDETPEATKEDTGRTSGTGSSKKTTGSASTGDYSDLGVIEDGLYESPQYGASVEWSDAWIINEGLDEPVLSDTKSATDRISLVRADFSKGDNETYGALTVKFFKAGADDTPQGVVDYWTSDDYLNGGAGDGSTVLLSDATKSEGSVVLVAQLDNGDTLVQYLSVFFLDRGKTAVMIEFYSTDLSIADAYADVESGITVDGQPVLTLFTDREIERALAKQ